MPSDTGRPILSWSHSKAIPTDGESNSVQNSQFGKVLNPNFLKSCFKYSKKVSNPFPSKNIAVSTASEPSSPLLQLIAGWKTDDLHQRILEIDPFEIAKQLTLAESFLLKNIRHREFLLETWSEKKSFDRDFWIRQPNGLKRMIDHTNALGLWVANFLLSIEDLKERTNALKFFIDVAVVSKNYIIVFFLLMLTK